MVQISRAQISIPLGIVILLAALAWNASLAEVSIEIGSSDGSEFDDGTAVIAACDACGEEAGQCDCDSVAATFSSELWNPKRAYAWQEHYMKFVPTGADEFGWFSWGSTPYRALGDSDLGITTSASIHWLKGPTTTPIPPRVYDFALGLQSRKQLGSSFSYDVAASIGVYSDFEDSARDGVRYVSHAVGFMHLNPDVDFVFGVDYLDRDDIPLLPVIGLSIRNTERNIVADLIFPRPRITFVLDDQHRLYLAGNLGGGSWDIERPNESNDVFTYSEIAITIGVDTLNGDGDGSERFHSVELGCVFQRELEFRDSTFEQELDDAFVIRFTTHY